MNNDLEQFSEERLIQMVKFCEPSIHGLLKHFETSDVAALARIALAAKQAKPVVNAEFKDGWPVINMMGVINGSEKLSDGFHDLYTTPRPAHTDQAIPDRNMLRNLVDLVWNEAKESTEVPSTKFADQLIDTAFPTGTPKPNGTLISEGTKNDDCQWNPDEDSVYSTGCGNEWQFTEGGIEQNKITYCPYCSGKISAPKPEHK